MRGPNDQPTDRNTVIFKIDFECTRNNKAPRGSTDPNELYVNSELKSSDIRWQPAGMQSEVFATNPPAPTNKNIVLAKLRPGQQMEMEMHAVKGVGKDHAKFSPVGRCYFPPVYNSPHYLLHFCSHGIVSFSSSHKNYQTYPATSCGEFSAVFLSRCHQH